MKNYTISNFDNKKLFKKNFKIIVIFICIILFTIPFFSTKIKIALYTICIFIGKELIDMLQSL